LPRPFTKAGILPAFVHLFNGILDEDEPATIACGGGGARGGATITRAPLASDGPPLESFGFFPELFARASADRFFEEFLSAADLFDPFVLRFVRRPSSPGSFLGRIGIV
jgi:hypothetical protein